MISNIKPPKFNTSHIMKIQRTFRKNLEMDKIRWKCVNFDFQQQKRKKTQYKKKTVLLTSISVPNHLGRRKKNSVFVPHLEKTLFKLSVLNIWYLTQRLPIFLGCVKLTGSSEIMRLG